MKRLIRIKLLPVLLALVACQNKPANYQLKKIRTTIENGLQRRPKRAASAQSFLESVLPALEQAVSQKDSTLFRSHFDAMTVTCNVCHVAEKVEFIGIVPPTQRYSPVTLSQIAEQ